MDIVDQLKLMEDGKVTVFPRDETIVAAWETIERLRAAFKDILLLDGKQMTARQKYAHSATLAERALNPHEHLTVSVQTRRENRCLEKF